MSRRLALVLSTVAALALLVELAVSSRASSCADLPAPSPFTTAAPVRPRAAPAAPRCITGPGAFASTLSPHVDLPSLPDLSRRAFTAERLAERAGAAPALPQRMGLSAPPVCR